MFLSDADAVIGMLAKLMASMTAEVIDEGLIIFLLPFCGRGQIIRSPSTPVPPAIGIFLIK